MVVVPDRVSTSTTSKKSGTLWPQGLPGPSFHCPWCQEFFQKGLVASYLKKWQQDRLTDRQHRNGLIGATVQHPTTSERKGLAKLIIHFWNI